MGLAEELQMALFAVRCSICLADPGERCISPQGKPLEKPHTDRIIKVQRKA